MTTVKAWSHPAKWSTAILAELGLIVSGLRSKGHTIDRVVDPFCGIGRRRLAQSLCMDESSVVGVDLQPECHVADSGTITGDATSLPADWTETFDAAVSSPVYGSRTSDKHQARDACKMCDGAGSTVLDDPCVKCDGTGLTKRMTYAHTLRAAGGDLVEGSAGGMLWGDKYRALHRAAILEMVRVVRPGGFVIVNMSNHIKTLKKGGPQVEQAVVEWFAATMTGAGGLYLDEVRKVATPRMGLGANGQSRVDGERVIVCRKRPA